MMKSRILVLFLVGLVAALITGGFATDSAFADVGPSSINGYPKVSSGYGLGKKAKVSYAVSQDEGLTDIKQTFIKIYVPASKTSAKVVVHNYDMCTTDAKQLGTTNSYDQTTYGTNTAWLNGRPNVVATFGLNNGSPASFKAHWTKRCASSAKTLTLKGGALNTSVDYRVYTLSVTGNSLAAAGAPYLNLFWLSGDNGVVFSQDSSRDAHSFGYQLSSPIPHNAESGKGTTYATTALPFGSSCSVVKNETARMSFYDVDSDDARVQPKDIYVRLIDKTSRTGQKLTHSGNGSLTGGNKGNNYRYKLIGGNRKTVYASFTAKPGHRYVLYIQKLFYFNTLQFTLPYDSIFYYADCLNADLKGLTTLDNNVIIPGQKATWTHQMYNQSTVGTALNVKATIHRQITTKDGKTTNSTRALVNNKTMKPRTRRPATPKKTQFAATEASVGSRICEWISWTANTGNDDNRSGNYCAVVGRQPKLQVWGGDLRSGGDVDTSRSSINGRQYGSWVEYGALLNGVNQRSSFGSGASLAGGPFSLSNMNANPLTFSNKNKDGKYGEFNNPSLDTLGSAYGLMANNLLGIPEKGNFSGGKISGLNGAYTAQGNLKITGGAIAAGKTILIRATGTVTITGNISFPGKVGNSGDIPQVIIVAHAININDNVKQINAWLLSDGTVNTCANKAKPTTSVCDKSLRINGLVTAKKVIFKRTAGSTTASPSKAGDPAELINLRADSYLWEYSQAAKSVIPTTVQTIQLPPRY